jgi:hypothetical protein
MAVVCGPEACAPRERGWRSYAGQRPAHPGSADGGRMRARGLRTQGARMAVACGSEARAPRERGWRSRAGRRLAHLGWRGWRSRAGQRPAHLGWRGWRSRAGRRPARLGSADGGRMWAGGWRSRGTGAFFRDNSARQSLKTRGSLHDLGVRSTSSLRQWHKNVISRYYLYR